MEQLDIVSFKNKRGHMLYGRITGITARAVTVKVFGFTGRHSISRIRKDWLIAKMVQPMSYADMTAHNLTSAGKTKKSKQDAPAKRKAYWQRIRESKENQAGRSTPLDIADRLAREIAA